MSEYESNDIEREYEQNEEENEEENYQGEEENNSNYNDKNNFNNNNFNNSKNLNYINEKMNQNENENEEQENNILNNLSSNKYQINNNNNESIDNNTLKNEKEEYFDETAENPETLYEEFFNYFLKPKKNTLNIKECKNAMRCLGLVVTEKEIQEFLEIKEKTGKEKINLENFKAICNKKLNETNNNNEELREAFEALDPEKSGIVDSNVLRHQMKIFKPKMTDEEMNQILSEFGEDKNGNINYLEYLRNLKG